MSYQAWFERRPDILNEEIKSFRENKFDFKLDKAKKENNRSIVFNGKVLVNEEMIELDLVYPSEFPAQPITVIANETNIYRHQNPFEKNLCVIPHNQDGWDSSLTGAYMVKQAIRLLEDAQKGEVAITKNEVDSPEPWSNYIKFHNPPLFITEHLPNNLAPVGNFKLSIYTGNLINNEEGGTFRKDHFVLEELNQNGETLNFAKSLPFQRKELKLGTHTGLWFYLPVPPNFNIYHPETVMNELEKQMGDTRLKRQINQFKLNKAKSKGKKGNEFNPIYFSFIFEEENYERNRFRKAFILGVYDFTKNRFIYSKPQYITKEEHFRRIPNFTPLKNKKVLIAGLGSLGSAVAVELGKCGVGSYVLIDKDALEVGNLVRHTGELDDIGLGKTKVIEQQILAHYPYAKVERLDCSIGYSVMAMEEIYKKISEVDVIINLTAEESVIKIFNRLSLELHIPVIHGWISNGAWGGRVIRTIPGKTGCYYCLENEHYKISSSPEGEIYPHGCGFPTFIGASYDIYGVATHVVRMAVNTMVGENKEYDHVIVQNYPIPKVELMNIKRDTTCPLCGE